MASSNVRLVQQQQIINGSFAAGSTQNAFHQPHHVNSNAVMKNTENNENQSKVAS